MKKKRILESKVKTRCCEKLESWGWYVLHLIQTNKNGITDTLIVRDGRYVWIEFKRDENSTPEPLQLYRISELRNLGCEVMVVNAYEDIFCLQHK